MSAAEPESSARPLRQQAVEGTLWSGIAQVGIQVTGLVATAILARLLLPREFGALGIAALFIGLGQQLIELGLGPALVQRKDLHPDHASTAFWATLAMAVLMTLLLVLAAPAVAAYFSEASVTNVIRLVSLDYILGALAMVPRSLLQRELRFRGIALALLMGGVGYLAGSVTVALLGGGVYALVAGNLALTASVNLVVWRVCTWRPKPRFVFQRFRELRRMSLHMLGANLLNYSGANVDFFLVGRFLGAGPLGVYTMAYNLATIPQRKLSRLLLSVLFPAFARIQDETARLKSAFLRSQRLLAVVVFPALAGLAFVARDFAIVVLSRKWLDAVLPIQILCAAGIVYAMSSSVSSFVLSRGRSDMLMWFGLVRLVAIGLFTLVGIRFGIAGVAWGVTAYALLFWIVFQHFVNRLADVRMSEYARALLPGFGGSLVMVAVLAAIAAVPGVGALPPVVRLPLLVAAGMGVYALALRGLFASTWNEGMSVARDFASTVRVPLRRLLPGARPS